MWPLKKKEKSELDILAEEIKQSIQKSKILQRTFSPVCPTCGKEKMHEITYDSGAHQELYWCSICGTINVEVDCKDTILVPKITKNSMKQEDPLQIEFNKEEENNG